MAVKKIFEGADASFKNKEIHQDILYNYDNFIPTTECKKCKRYKLKQKLYAR